MYQPHHAQFRTGGFVGRVPRSDPHSLIDREAGSPEQRRRAAIGHVAALLDDLIRHEQDGVKKAQYTADELKKYSVNDKALTIVMHIVQQGQERVALLNRIRTEL